MATRAYAIKCDGLYVELEFGFWKLSKNIYLFDNNLIGGQEFSALAQAFAEVTGKIPAKKNLIGEKGKNAKIVWYPATPEGVDKDDEHEMKNSDPYWDLLNNQLEKLDLLYNDINSEF